MRHLILRVGVRARERRQKGGGGDAAYAIEYLVNEENAQLMFDGLAAARDGEPVEGFGDQAAFDQYDQYSVLSIRDGPYLVKVEFQGAPQADPRGALEGLARRLLEQL